MLLASYSGKTRNSLDKMPNIVIWWQPSTSRINFERAENLDNPANQVFKDALVELVENIRCDRAIDVDIW